MSLSDELRACANGRFGVKTNKDYMLQAANEIDRQAALIAKYEAALQQYADHKNWARTDHFSRHVDWWQPDTHGWALAENAQKGADEQ